MVGSRVMQDAYMDGIGRVESGTETENGSLGHAYTDVGGRATQEQLPRKPVSRITHTAMDGG